MNNNTLKRKLSKAYDENKLTYHFTESECQAINWGMYSWQNSHSSSRNTAQYTSEQYSRAYKKRIIYMCLETGHYTIND